MEETLSSEERNNILKQISAKPEDVPSQKKSEIISEGVTDYSKLSFGELLEKTIEQRNKLDEEDKESDKRLDESRKQAISLSRMDILKDFRL